MKDKTIDIIKNFKISETIKDDAIEKKIYKSEKFPDYSVISVDDKFHSTTYEIYRNGFLIYVQEKNLSMTYIAEVLLKDEKNPQPYYHLVFDGRKNCKVVVDVFDELSEKFSNGDEKTIKKRGYYYKSVKINDNGFRTAFFHIDENGNPTTEYTIEDYDALTKKLEKQLEESGKNRKKRK